VASDNRTEKATPKRRDQARRKGQVARSPEVNTAVALLAGLIALVTLGPHLFAQMKGVLGQGLAQSGDTSLAGTPGLGMLAHWALLAVATAIGPILGIMAVAGVLANVVQVRFRASPEALKPSLKRLDPAAGFKRLFGPQAAVTTGKTLLKTAAIGGVTFLAVWPKLQQLGGLVGLPPSQLAPRLGGIIAGVGFRAGAAIAAIALLDYLWQRRTHEKSIRMAKDEVKQEARESDLSPEVRGALRRKQYERARRRMIAAVPSADVVVTNPTHFAVALRYDRKQPAPQVVAKGVDHLAASIRRAAEEHGVPVVENPPLARALYREVELDALIPEAFFAAVAEVLAFVYRTARRRPAPAVRRRPALGAARRA